MKIKYNIDTIGLTKKPTAGEAGTIRKTLCNETRIVETTPEVLIDRIEHGYTFTPGVMTGTKADTWQSQQIIVADIDNTDSKHNPITHPVTPETARQIMEFYELEPYFMYYTFSNTEDLPRFRVVLILDEPLTDPTEAEEIKEEFTNIFNRWTAPENCADTTMKDNARIIYGSTPGSVFYKTGTITSTEALRKIARNARELRQNERKQSTVKDYAENSRRSNNGIVDDVERMRILLEHIDADDRKVWINVGLCIKNNGGSVYDWDEWSRKSTKYKPGECSEKWDGLDVQARPIGIGYLYNLASENGFNLRDYLIEQHHTEEPPHELPPEDPGAVDPETGLYENVPAEDVEPVADPDDVLNEFLNEIQSERFKPIKTGLSQLDNALDGGLERKTLVTLASAPGVGKTAFCQYLFENMARSGHDVIYVNLEMDRSQLLSRSIARIAYERREPAVKVSSMTWAKTAQQIIDNDVTAITVRRGYKWTDGQRKKIMDALDDYRENIAPHFYYVTTNPENSGAIKRNLSDIIQKLELMTEAIEADGRPAPLVCIDYLQFVNDDLYTFDNSKKPDTAEAIAEILGTFKAYAMKHSTVVLLIMANNRTANKDGRASMDSGRDTSNIEYSGDTMLSLTYTAIEDRWITPELNEDGTPKKDSKNNTKYQTIDIDNINARKDICAENGTESTIGKRLCVKVVKSRGGQARKSARFIFDGAHMSFTEDLEPVEHGKIIKTSEETIIRKQQEYIKRQQAEK